jgi:hypothetical protein
MLLLAGVPCICGGQDKPAATATPQSKSTYVTAPNGDAADKVNRKALEDRAGPDGGKLLVRSVPSASRVFVDDKYVGHTPLLLIVAPGKYKVQVLGPGEESGERIVDLGAKETQQVALTLTARYPDHVAAR